MIKQENVLNIRILIFQDNLIWVAQCLEFDIAAQGNSLKEVQAAFVKMFVSKIVIDLENGIEPLSQLKKAPQYYHNLFKNSEQLASKPEIETLPKIRGINTPPYHITERRIHA